MPREFPAERDAILPVSPSKTGAQCRRKRTRGNRIFEIQLRLVAFFFLPFSLLCPFTYDLQKKKKRGKKLFRLFRQKFSTKYFSRHGGCLVSPVVRKGFSVVGFKKETSGTGRRPVQVHPTDLNSWPERSLSCFSTPT